MPKPKNFFDDVPVQLPQELMQTLVETANVRVERIVSRGHRSEAGLWYDQPQHEWVIVLRGSACVHLEHGEVYPLKAGDYINIPAHARHRVEWTDSDCDTVWLAVHYS
jgi:cupin 2 domain-containing protein